jgi:hypothetical protein
LGLREILIFALPPSALRITGWRFIEFVTVNQFAALATGVRFRIGAPLESFSPVVIKGVVNAAFTAPLKRATPVPLSSLRAARSPAELVTTPSTPLVPVRRPVWVARIRDLPEVPAKRASSPSTEVETVLERSPVPPPSAGPCGDCMERKPETLIQRTKTRRCEKEKSFIINRPS